MIKEDPEVVFLRPCNSRKQLMVGYLVIALLLVRQVWFAESLVHYS